MNIISSTLSAPNTNYTTVLPELVMDDYTCWCVSLSNIPESTPPLYVTIDWGDGSKRVEFDNDVYRDLHSGSSRVMSPVLYDIYTHEYFPPENTTYKRLSAQFLIHYPSEDIYIVQPIKIRAYGFMESISELTLINTNILPLSSNPAEHQLKTKTEGYIVEVRSY